MRTNWRAELRTVKWRQARKARRGGSGRNPPAEHRGAALFWPAARGGYARAQPRKRLAAAREGAPQAG